MSKEIKMVQGENGNWSINTNIKDGETILDGLTIGIMGVCKSAGLTLADTINEANARMAVYEDLSIDKEENKTQGGSY